MCTTRKDVMMRKLDKRTELKQKMDELQYELDEVENYIKEAMKTDGKEVLEVGPYKVTYKEFMKNSFDTTLFRKENEEIYESYSSLKPQTRLTVSIK